MGAAWRADGERLRAATATELLGGDEGEEGQACMHAAGKDAGSGR